MVLEPPGKLAVAARQVLVEPNLSANGEQARQDGQGGPSEQGSIVFLHFKRLLSLV